MAVTVAKMLIEGLSCEDLLLMGLIKNVLRMAME